MQRNRVNTYRLWRRHSSFYAGAWDVLSSGSQADMSSEKKTMEAISDSEWSYKVLPVGSVPTDLDSEF